MRKISINIKTNRLEFSYKSYALLLFVISLFITLVGLYFIFDPLLLVQSIGFVLFVTFSFFCLFSLWKVLHKRKVRIDDCSILFSTGSKIESVINFKDIRSFGFIEIKIKKKSRHYLAISLKRISKYKPFLESSFPLLDNLQLYDDSLKNILLIKTFYITKAEYTAIRIYLKSKGLEYFGTKKITPIARTLE